MNISIIDNILLLIFLAILPFPKILAPVIKFAG